MVYHVDNALPVTPSEELPEGFFNVTVRDVRLMYSDFKKQTQVITFTSTRICVYACVCVLSLAESLGISVKMSTYSENCPDCICSYINYHCPSNGYVYCCNYDK